MDSRAIFTIVCRLRQHTSTKKGDFCRDPRQAAKSVNAVFHGNWRPEHKPLEISQVVYGTAFSSVKVEHDFSGFALVYSHLRTRISNDFLNSIMVVKNNLDLIDKI